MELNIDQIKATTDKIKIPFIFFTISNDAYLVDHANEAAKELFGYENVTDLDSKDILDLFNVGSDSGGSSVRESLLVTKGDWVYVEANKKDGSKFPVGVNAVEVRDDKNLYILSIIRDRTESVKTRKELEKALKDAKDQKEAADVAREEALKAKEEAEALLFKEKKLSAQVELLKYIFKGVLSIIILLSMLVLIGWFSGKYEKESLSMFERILLVLTGMLGTAMAGVFDSKRLDNGK